MTPLEDSCKQYLSNISDVWWKEGELEPGCRSKDDLIWLRYICTLNRRRATNTRSGVKWSLGSLELWIPSPWMSTPFIMPMDLDPNPFHSAPAVHSHKNCAYCHRFQRCEFKRLQQCGRCHIVFYCVSFVCVSSSIRFELSWTPDSEKT